MEQFQLVTDLGTRTENVTFNHGYECVLNW